MTHPREVEDHFRVFHNDIIGHVQDIPSDVLKPRNQLIPPDQFRVLPLPPLPKQELIPLSIIVPPSIPPTARRRGGLPIATSGRKWSRMNVPDEEELKEQSFTFDDLPSFPHQDPSSTDELKEMIVRKSLPSFSSAMRLSEPQSMREPFKTDPKPTASITYNVFAQRFQKLEEGNVVESHAIHNKRHS